MRTAILAIGTMAALSVLAPAEEPAAPPSVPLPQELARVLTDYETAWRAGDGAALARLFAEDGFVLPNGGPPVRGRDAVRQYYKGPGGPLVLRAFAFATEGSTGYILGGFARQEGQADVGKFTLTLRKGADGRWLIVSDMDSGNRPPSRSAAGAGGSTAAAEQEVAALERAWSAAFLKHDLAAISRILAEDFVGVDGRGVVSDRAAELEEAKEPPPGATGPTVAGEELSDVRVRVYGDAAVLNAVNTVRMASKGTLSVVRYRRTTVWVKREGRWQCVSFHGSRILEAPPPGA